MAIQLPRGARPSGRFQASGIIFFIFSCSRPLTGRRPSKPVAHRLDGDSFLPLRPDPNLQYSSSFTRLLIFFLLLASGNVHPNPGLTPVRPTNPIYIPAPLAPEKLGLPQSNAAAARGGSTPPAPGSLDPLSGPYFPGVM